MYFPIREVLQLLKGVNKRVIIIKEPQSEIFEEAYFIMRSGKGLIKTPKENDMVAEANRILSAYNSQREHTPIRRKTAADSEKLPTLPENPTAGKSIRDLLDDEDAPWSAGNANTGGSQGSSADPAFRMMSAKTVRNRNKQYAFRGFLAGVAAMSAVVIIVQLIFMIG